MDSALEAVENVALTANDHFEREMIVVAAHLTRGHWEAPPLFLTPRLSLMGSGAYPLVICQPVSIAAQPTEVERVVSSFWIDCSRARNLFPTMTACDRRRISLCPSCERIRLGLRLESGSARWSRIAEKPHLHGQRNTKTTTTANTKARNTDGLYPHRLLYGYNGRTPSSKRPTAISKRMSTFTEADTFDSGKPRGGPLRIPTTCRHRDAVGPTCSVRLLGC